MIYKYFLGHQNVVEVLAKNGADVNVKSKVDNVTPLFTAVWEGKMN